MRVRRTLLAAALAAAATAALAAGGASASCDPSYRPLCADDCTTRPPDLRDPLEYLTRVCPD